MGGDDSARETAEQHLSIDENGLNRRSVLRATAGAVAAGSVGNALLGNVGASSYEDQCTGSADYNKDEDYYWSKSDDSYTQEYCSGPGGVDRGQITANILYYGSVRNDNTETWYHDFVTSGHSEGFVADHNTGCDWREDFSRTKNIYKTYEFFENNEPGETDIPKERGSKVKAWPTVGDSTNSEIYTDLLLTTLTEALGATPAWPMATAIDYAAVVEDNFESRDRNNNTLEYKWGYGRDNVKPCATNYVFQNVESHAGEDDSVDFTYYNEHWIKTAAANERWMQVSFNVSYYDAKSGSASSTSTSSATTDRTGTSKAVESKVGGSFSATGVEPGDVVEARDGRPARVERIGGHTERFPGSAPERRHVADLPGALGRHVDTETVMFRHLPLEVTVQTASGVMLG